MVWTREYALQLDPQVKEGAGFEVKQNKITLPHEGQTGEPRPMLPENQHPAELPPGPLDITTFFAPTGTQTLLFLEPGMDSELPTCFQFTTLPATLCLPA